MSGDYERSAGTKLSCVLQNSNRARATPSTIFSSSFSLTYIRLLSIFLCFLIRFVSFFSFLFSFSVSHFRFFNYWTISYRYILCTFFFFWGDRVTQQLLAWINLYLCTCNYVPFFNLHQFLPSVYTWTWYWYRIFWTNCMILHWFRISMVIHTIGKGRKKGRELIYFSPEDLESSGEILSYQYRTWSGDLSLDSLTLDRQYKDVLIRLFLPSGCGRIFIFFKLWNRYECIASINQNWCWPLPTN